MPEKFLTIEELSKRLILFKDTWYGVAENVEKLSNYRSGFDGGFKKRTKSIKTDLEKCRSGLEEINLHLKHHFPRLREEIGKNTGAVVESLKDFAILAEKDLGDLSASADLDDEMSALQKQFEVVEKKYKTVEMRANEACSKYFEAKSNYSVDLGKVKRLSQKSVQKLVKRYSKDIAPLKDGCEMVLDGEAIEVRDLFKRLFKDPSRADQVSLTAKEKGKGLLGPLSSKKKRQGELKPRISVLRYVLHEAVKELVKIKEEGENNFSKVEAKHVEFAALEKACTDLEEKRKKLEGPRKELLRRIEKAKKNPGMRFASYDGVLEAREAYLKRFNELNEKVKPYLSIVGDALEGYESFETDIEKRELMEEVRRLKKEVKGYRDKLSELGELHEELRKKHEDALKGLKKLI